MHLMRVTKMLGHKRAPWRLVATKLLQSLLPGAAYWSRTCNTPLRQRNEKHSCRGEK